MAEMEFKGTPGPWSIDPNNGDIVSGHLNVGIPYASRQEDKQLMAAGFDMLEALRVAKATIKLDGERLRDEFRSTHQSDHALEVIDAALAKALQS